MSQVSELEKENAYLKQTIANLSLEREKYKKLFDVSADALSILDLDTGRFVECNQSAIEMHGVENEANFLNLTPADLSPEFQPCGGSSHELAVEKITRTFSIGPQIFQWQHAKMDGSTFPCLVSLTALPVENKKLVLAIGRDISELTETQRQLQNAQKTALAGQLSAGICHDLNNIMAVVSGNAEIISHFTHSDEVKKFADKIVEGIGRAKGVTDRLLKLAKPCRSNLEVFELDKTIGGELEFYNEAINNDIRFISSLESDAFVEVDVNTFKDAVINLVVNAGKAIDGVGLISIETSRSKHFDSRQDFIFSCPKQAAEYACIKVKDTGAGIPYESMEKIFNPFVSERGNAAGEGLGLSVVSAFAVNNSCGLTVKSEVGTGTEFCLWLPVVCKQDSSTPKKENTALPGLNALNVVIVEDEENLLSIYTMALKIAGASVSAFDNPYDAQNFIAQHADSINVLQTDQTLGTEMHGTDLIDWVRNNFPKITTILLTGFSSDPRINCDKTIVLEKPISIERLPHAINEAVNTFCSEQSQ